MFFSGQVRHLILTQQSSFSVTEEKKKKGEEKKKGRKTHEQVTTKGGCSKGLENDLQGGDVHGLQISGGQ